MGCPASWGRCAGSRVQATKPSHFGGMEEARHGFSCALVSSHCAVVVLPRELGMPMVGPVSRRSLRASLGAKSKAIEAQDRKTANMNIEWGLRPSVVNTSSACTHTGPFCLGQWGCACTLVPLVFVQKFRARAGMARPGLGGQPSGQRALTWPALTKVWF